MPSLRNKLIAQGKYTEVVDELKQPLLGQEFEPLSQQVTELLSLKERGSDMHAISNLALLNMSDNCRTQQCHL